MSSRLLRLSVFLTATALIAFTGAGGTGSASTVTGPSALTGDSATFDGGAGTWAPFTAGVSLSSVSTPVQAGSGALAIRNDNSTTVDMWAASGGGPTSWVAAQPDATYTATASFRAAATARTMQPVLMFFASNGSTAGSSWGQAVTDTSSDWTAAIPVVGLAPTNTAYVALVVITYGASPGETHFVDSVSLTETTGGPDAIATPMATRGNQIVDANGRPVVLRGVQLTRTHYSTAEIPNDAVIAGIRRWRANFVRVPMNEALWLNTCTTGTPSNDPGYPAAIDALVDSITSRGMVAMLTLSFNTITPCGTSKPQPMADATYGAPFWQQLAARYGSNPLVVFDLYNEPHDMSDSTWLRGGPVTWNGTTFIAAGMQQLYDTVRAEAPTSLVFTGGQGWASRPSTTKVAGTNIVLSAHAYTCPEHPPPGCPRPNPYDPSQLLDRWNTVGATSPVMITEFGWPNYLDGTYLRNLVADAEAHGWGWNAFGWTATSGEFRLNADLGPQFEPTPVGQPILAGLANN